MEVGQQVRAERRSATETLAVVVGHDEQFGNLTTELFERAFQLHHQPKLSIPAEAV